MVRRSSTLGGADSEGPQVVEVLVPTPVFSGQTRFTTPNAISFAPATTKFATPMTHGTLMIDFAAEPRVLRDWDDLFPAESFIELVITWPGLEEWRISMVHLVEGRDYISRAELAQFVMDQFNLFTNITDASAWPSPEWRLGEVPNAYNVKNTSLAFLWSPAPCVWQPAFRVRKQL